jgi:2'-5' RNA ligase
MAVSFLVEFRLQGYAKKYAKWASARTFREAKKLRIRELPGRRFVSHITLFGSAKTNNISRVISEVERIGRKYTLIPFKIKGVSRFDNLNKKVIYLDIEPSPILEQFRRELAENLVKLSFEYAPWDTRQNYEFHSTVGMFKPTGRSNFDRLCGYTETYCSLKTFKQSRTPIFRRLFNIIKKYIFRIQEYDPTINLYLLRVTVLGRGSRIQCEYDLVLKRLLSRSEALSGHWWRKTIEKLGDLRR